MLFPHVLLTLLFISIRFDAVNSFPLATKSSMPCSTSVGISQKRRKNNKYKDDVMRTVLLN